MAETWAQGSVQLGHSWPLSPAVLWASGRPELGGAVDQGPGLEGLGKRWRGHRAGSQAAGLQAPSC